MEGGGGGDDSPTFVKVASIFVAGVDNCNAFLTREHGLEILPVCGCSIFSVNLRILRALDL